MLDMIVGPSFAVALVVISSAFALPCWAQANTPWGDTAVPQSNLTSGDIRYIQDALVWNEVYVGLKDGGWGPMTQTAVDAWRKRLKSERTGGLTPREIAALMGLAWKAKDDVGWKVWIDPRTGAAVGYPSKYVMPESIPTSSTDNPRTKYSGSSGVTLIAHRTYESNIASLVESLPSKYDVKSVDYRLSRPFRQVIAFTTRDDSKIYVRYDITNNGWSGFFLGLRSDVPKYSLISTAISTDFSADGTRVLPGPDAVPTIGAVFRWVGNDMPNTIDGKPLPAQTQAPAVIAPPIKEDPRKIVSAGTAFAISPKGEYVTNAHVIDGCTEITRPDGVKMKIIAVDLKRDLALLYLASENLSYLRLRRDQTIDLGEGVFLAGFPYYGSISTSLNLTNGIVTSLKGIGDTTMHFQMNANLQPGNSGGPVLDTSGAVIGVAVSRISDITVLKNTGTIPQGMNYAIRGSVLEAFLLENDILLDKKSDKFPSNSRDIAKSATETVIPALCWR